ncbi:amino acid acetyltransferase [Xaviernesmea oryzae]|uniref:Amino acid acetyltransferase n=1 Tax=Xaviernesmea oryzae TaxID=464029 RepID=A0A1Q9AWQ0_9HYPH|nr:GNAT family protein [Xaviernesmea oryzae]OLP59859.1 amino acid acetyltransferase [Xaviernesmea oryzae]SEK48468.1 Protein N-acetyltransferase, RimJ/RimL family [Xaviernesmea oryzae]
MPLSPVALSGKTVTLVPLSPDHHDGLVSAVRDGALWRLWYTAVPKPEDVAAHIERCLKRQTAGTMLPFTVIDHISGDVVGMTTYLNIDLDTPRLEIGATWYAKRVQRTALNTEAKLLLLSHAFDQLGCLAVELRTHVMNHQSRRAIERLGARLDGILRQHMRMADGTLRDTCVYSILDREWPTVRTHLAHKLQQHDEAALPA